MPISKSLNPTGRAVLMATMVALCLICGSKPAFAQYAANQRIAARPSGVRVAAAPARYSLPPTRLDSFVREAAQHAEHIYGDEGTTGPPPYLGFNKAHRINTGILGERDQGITTGHGSYMPDAWGRDEFLAPEEFTQSGPRGDARIEAEAGEVEELPPGGAGGGPGGQDIPPPPGPGYQPCYQHGVFVGYYSPEEVALAQTDFRACLRSFVNSDRYIGGEAGRLSILYEIGDISSPFGPT